MKLIKVTEPERTLMIPDECYQTVGRHAYFHVYTSKNQVILNLPSLQHEIKMRFWFNIFIFDIDKNCEVNNIIVRAEKGEFINGKSEIVLKSNGVGAMLAPLGNNDWMCVASITPSPEKIKPVPTTAEGKKKEEVAH